MKLRKPHATLIFVTTRADAHPTERPGILLFGAVMTLFGLSSMDFDLASVLPGHVVVRALEPLGFKEAAMRATLRRNVAKGLLTHERSGAEVRYSLSETGRSLVSQGQQRVSDPNALTHQSDEWTMLTIPEGPTLRNERYQLHLRLAWAGFGRLMPNVWITPGRVDVTTLLQDAFEGTPPVDAIGFTAVPIARDDVSAMIARAWDLDAIRAEHATFLSQWASPTFDRENPLADLVHLLNDWGTLLLVDPGLPSTGLPRDWPGKGSQRALTSAKARLWDAAREQLQSLLGI